MKKLKKLKTGRIKNLPDLQNFADLHDLANDYMLGMINSGDTEYLQVTENHKLVIKDADDEKLAIKRVFLVCPKFKSCVYDLNGINPSLAEIDNLLKKNQSHPALDYLIYAMDELNKSADRLSSGISSMIFGGDLSVACMNEMSFLLDEFKYINRDDWDKYFSIRLMLFFIQYNVDKDTFFNGLNNICSDPEILELINMLAEKMDEEIADIILNRPHTEQEIGQQIGKLLNNWLDQLTDDDHWFVHTILFESLIIRYFLLEKKDYEPFRYNGKSYKISVSLDKSKEYRFYDMNVQTKKGVLIDSDSGKYNILDKFFSEMLDKHTFLHNWRDSLYRFFARLSFECMLVKPLEDDTENLNYFINNYIRVKYSFALNQPISNKNHYPCTVNEIEALHSMPGTIISSSYNGEVSIGQFTDYIE